MIKKLFIILFLILYSSVIAQRFDVSVSKNVVALNEQIQLKYEFEADDTPKSFSPPILKNIFNVVSGPSQSSSSSVKIVNGKYSSTKTYSITYILKPKKTGKIVIQPAKIIFKDKTFSTKKIAITVNKSSKNSSQEKIFIKATLSKKNVYIGEQVTLTYKLYTQLNVSEFGLENKPNFTNFWVEKFDIPQQPKLNAENINGIQYRTAVIEKIALFPQKSGEIEIEAANYNAIVQVKGKNNFFNDPFFSSSFARSEKKSLLTNSLSLNVKELPKKPLGTYLGAGDFKMEVTLDNEEIKINEALNLKVKFSGSGNIKLIKEPKFRFSNDFEQYDPTVKQTINTKSNSISGTKIYQYLIIPRNLGTFFVEPLKFSYFDLKTKTIKYLNTPKFKIKVFGEASDKLIASSSNLSQKIEFMNQNILFIKTKIEDKFYKQNYYFYKTKYFSNLIIILISILIIILTTNIVFIRRKMQYSKIKYNKALKNTFKLFKNAQKLLDKKNVEKFADLMENGFLIFFSDKLKIPLSKLNFEFIRDELNKFDIPTEIISNIEEQYNQIAMIKYASNDVNIDEEIISKIRNNLIEINKYISSKR